MKSAQASCGARVPVGPARTRRRAWPPLTSRPARALLCAAQRLPAGMGSSTAMQQRTLSEALRNTKGPVRAVATERGRTDAQTQSRCSWVSGTTSRSGPRTCTRRRDLLHRWLRWHLTAMVAQTLVSPPRRHWPVRAPRGPAPQHRFRSSIRRWSAPDAAKARRARRGRPTAQRRPRRPR